jgi:hypothetical protein
MDSTTSMPRPSTAAAGSSHCSESTAAASAAPSPTARVHADALAATALARHWPDLAIHGPMDVARVNHRHGSTTVIAPTL